jgi:ribosomal protein S18 acetylase RimI-like enzyme
MRRAGKEDISILVELMAEFYAEGGYKLNRATAAEAFAALLSDERRGLVWILCKSGQDVGHLVLTLRFAMEHGGIIGYVDDLYVRAAWRNQGVASAALAEVRGFAEMQGLRALTVEAAPDNGPAQTAYSRAGFEVMPGRQVMALALAAPSHVA